MPVNGTVHYCPIRFGKHFATLTKSCTF